MRILALLALLLPLAAQAQPIPASGCPLSGCTFNSGSSLVVPYITNGSLGTQALGAGGSLVGPLSFSSALSGTKTGGSQSLGLIQTTSDTVAAGGGGLLGLYVNLTDGGTGTTGNRVGIYSNLNFAGGATNKGLGLGSLYGGLWSYATASGNVGGTSGAANAYGSLWGGIASATLASGATFWSAVNGLEVDVGVSTGASATYVQGEKIVLANHNQAVQSTDYMLGMAMLSGGTQGIGNGLVFGSPDGWWPIDSTGTIIGTVAPLAGGPAYSVANIIDFSAVTASGFFLKGPASNFTVNGSGNVVAGQGNFTGNILQLTNGTSNLLYYSGVGAAAPAFTTRSLGTKIVMFPLVDATHVDYAQGIGSGSYWFSLPQANAGTTHFDWYAGTTVEGSLSDSGVMTLHGGIAASGGFAASPRNIGTCEGAPNVAYTAQTPIATEFYVAEVFVPANVTVTGVAVFNSATISGNMKVGLANSSGVNVATSASTAMAGTSADQRVPFTGTYAAVGPATYYVTVFYDNATVRPNTITAGSCGVQKATGQVYATGFTSFTPAGTFTTALGPVATLY